MPPDLPPERGREAEWEEDDEDEDEEESEPQEDDDEDEEEPDREEEPRVEEDDDEPERERERETDEDEEDEDEPEPEEEEEEEPAVGGAVGCSAAAWTASRFGAFLRCSRMPSVMPPRPMAVQKLIAKRVFLGASSGKRPANLSHARHVAA